MPGPHPKFLPPRAKMLGSSSPCQFEDRLLITPNIVMGEAFVCSAATVSLNSIGGKQRHPM
jgi:hypothetical protein